MRGKTDMRIENKLDLLAREVGLSSGRDLERVVSGLAQALFRDYMERGYRQTDIHEQKTAMDAISPGQDGKRKLLTVGELSEYISIPKASLYVMVSMRKIPQKAIVHLGRSLRFDLAEIDAWVNQSKSA